MAHEPIQFVRDGAKASEGDDGPRVVVRPAHLDLQRDKALTIRWADGRVSVYPIAYLRQHSPAADAKVEREQAATNPLHVLSDRAARGMGQPLTAEGIELVGNYACRIRFSDGHDTGLYSWNYLRHLDASMERGKPENLERTTSE